jgi:hypothetical protein
MTMGVTNKEVLCKSQNLSCQPLPDKTSATRFPNHGMAASFSPLMVADDER